MARQINPRYDLDKFKHCTKLHVRFADLDALGHVNHAKYLTYMEQARMQYAADVWEWDGQMESLSMIVAFAEVDYLAPLYLNDEVSIYTRLSHLGNKSFELAYVLYRRDGTSAGQLVATGKTTMVMFDYVKNQTIPVDARWRETSLAYEHHIDT